MNFGLAKPGVEAAGGNSADSPTTIGPTQGVLLGTAPYMSPEQARGKPVDKRADIWAFGCVLYEMMTGRRAFAGETPFEAVAALLERDPDWSRLPQPMPVGTRRLLTRCLEKDPRRRLRDIADARIDLDNESTAPVVPAKSLAGKWIPWTVAAGVGVLALAGWLRPRTTAAPPLRAQFSFPAPDGQTLELSPAVPSPDGTRIAFVARQESEDRALWIRRLDSATPQRIAGSEGASGAPLWSPDGRFVAFVARGHLKKADPASDSTVNVCPMQVNLGATWNANNVIVMAPANRNVLHRVSADGGALQPITTLDANRRENSHRFPQFLPDGRHFLFTARSDVKENNTIYVGSLDSSEVKPLLTAQSNGLYAPPGYLLFAQDGTLFAQPFDPGTLQLSGEKVAVATRIAHVRSSSSAMFAVSADGTVLTYVPEVNRLSRLTWFNRMGTAVGSIGPEKDYADIRIAPNGQQASIVIPDANSGNRDIWLLEFAGGSLRRLTSHPATDWQPAWAPDSRRIAFASDRDGKSSIYQKSIDDEAETLLLRIPDAGVFPKDWSTDGQIISFFQEVGIDSGDLWALPLAGNSKPYPLVQTSFLENAPRLSPDGRWVAYESDESGDVEIYLKSLSGPGKRRLSMGGGHSPRWRRDGRELFYTTDTGDVISVTLGGSDSLVPTSSPSRLFRVCTSPARLASYQAGLTYDVAADGKQFLIACNGPGATPLSVAVSVHWSAALR